MYVHKRLTRFVRYSKPKPIGINAAATAKNIGITFRAVRIGCHAGSRCCLNAVSIREKKT